LGSQVWGGAKEEPYFVVGHESQLGLASRAAVKLAVPESLAIAAGAIPLGKTTPGSRAEDFYAHSCGDRQAVIALQLGVGVRADLAVQVDLFVLRCGPFHGQAP
jgi:hypothetical protein